MPMSNNIVRALSLEGHVALSVLRSGQGDAFQVSQLARVVYMSYFLRDVTAAGSDIEQFRIAETVVEECVTRALNGERWELKDEDFSAVEHILLLYDAQLAAAPAYRFADAWQQFQRVIIKHCQTPIEGSNIDASSISIDAVAALIQ
ncbi:hypothetical protein WK76_24095 [Burkholderia ubonensis]|nr:hypothetical protein WK76_24095 [Burkholderia ubonensis]